MLHLHLLLISHDIVCVPCDMCKSIRLAIFPKIFVSLEILVYQLS